MINRKYKHSKVKNTGLVFEFLLRQVTVDVLNKIDNSIALDIVKKKFHETTELGKELKFYQLLVNEKFSGDKKADYFITEVLKKRDSLNQAALKREKYNVIKSIMEHYNVTEFFSSKVNDYKVYASIYKLFEYKDVISPEEKTLSYFNLLEHITTRKSTNKKVGLIDENLKNDADLRILCYKILLEKFNKKYSTLDSAQKKLLKTYQT